uniref:NADH dehydrogenase subunit 2 n=2 Tax=Trichuris TaxID=36086 RepID=A0A0M4R4E0_9BILA|nr:NADH dehydrogenase subunit 2 [Trichuris suis]
MWYMLYTLIVIISFTVSNWLSMWTVLELSSWIMMILTLNDSWNEVLFKMYMMLSMSSIMLILLWLQFSSQEEWILCLLAFKMGMPPLHWWVGWVMKHMKWKIMWWFTTFHKIIPMMISLLTINSILIFWWSTTSVIWSSMSFLSSVSYFMIFFYSSCIHTSWLWLTTYNLYTFFMYVLFYTLIMYFIFMKVKHTESWTYNNEFTWMMIVLLGIPTSMMFFVKFTTLSIYLNHMTLLMWILFLMNMVTILPYTRMIWNLMSNSLLFNNKYTSANTSILSVFLVTSQFMLWPVSL